MSRCVRHKLHYDGREYAVTNNDAPTIPERDTATGGADVRRSTGDSGHRFAHNLAHQTKPARPNLRYSPRVNSTQPPHEEAPQVSSVRIRTGISETSAHSGSDTLRPGVVPTGFGVPFAVAGKPRPIARQRPASRSTQVWGSLERSPTIVPTPGDSHRRSCAGVLMRSSALSTSGPRHCPPERTAWSRADPMPSAPRRSLRRIPLFCEADAA